MLQVCLVLFAIRRGSARQCIQRSNWTSDLSLFQSWLDAVPNLIEGSGKAAVQEALSEIVYMFQRPTLSSVDPDRVQKHCLMLVLSEDGKADFMLPADSNGVTKYSNDVRFHCSSFIRKQGCKKRVLWLYTYYFGNLFILEILVFMIKWNAYRGDLTDVFGCIEFTVPLVKCDSEFNFSVWGMMLWCRNAILFVTVICNFRVI